MKHKVIFENKIFYGIKEFDCRTVYLYTTAKYKNHQGTFSTFIPISNLEFRKTHLTKAFVKIQEDKDYTIFYIYDDYGREHIMKISNSLQKEINNARIGALKHDLIKDMLKPKNEEEFKYSLFK